MRKTIFVFFTTLLISAAFLLGPKMCVAAHPEGEAALGGITLGSTVSYVESVYGQPRGYRTIQGVAGPLKASVYGGSFLVGYYKGIVQEVITTANNGIKTPAGLTVGMSERHLLATYPAKPGYYSDTMVNKYSYVFTNGQYLDVEVNKETRKVSYIRLRYEG